MHSRLQHSRVHTQPVAPPQGFRSSRYQHIPANQHINFPRSRRQISCLCKLRFVLYTKPECPLCDGLKDKLLALIDRAQFMPSFLTGASLQVRDISTNEVWQDAMHLAVPVLGLLDSEGNEVVLPRPQPRIPADRLQQHLHKALQEAGIDSSGNEGGGSGDTGAQPFTVISS